MEMEVYSLFQAMNAANEHHLTKEWADRMQNVPQQSSKMDKMETSKWQRRVKYNKEKSQCASHRVLYNSSFWTIFSTNCQTSPGTNKYNQTVGKDTYAD